MINKQTATLTGIEHEIADDIREEISQALAGHPHDPYTGTYDLQVRVCRDAAGHPRQMNFTVNLDLDYDER